MKHISILSVLLAGAMLLTSVPAHAVTADEPASAAAASIEISNALPYSFEELLDVDDENFLSNPDISEHIKRAFMRIRACERNGEPRLIFRLDDRIIFRSTSTPERKTEVCHYLGIPESMVSEIGTFNGYGGEFPLYLKFNKDLDAYTANRAVIWLTFQSTIAAMQHNYGNFPNDGVIGGSGYDIEDWKSYYDIPYTFEEFLALDDAAFLSDQDVPEKVKKVYQEIRGEEGLLFTTVALDLENGVTLPDDPGTEAFRHEWLELLGIPEEIVASVRVSEMYQKEVVLRLRHYAPEDTYKGYSMPYVYDKAVFFMMYQPAIGQVIFDTTEYYYPNTAKNWDYYAKQDDYAVYCEYCERFGIQAADTLPGEQEQTLVRDEMGLCRNVFDLYLGSQVLSSEDETDLHQKGAAYFGFPESWSREIHSPLEIAQYKRNSMIVYLRKNAAETRHFEENYIDRLRAELTIWNSEFAKEYAIESIRMEEINVITGGMDSPGHVTLDNTIDIMDVIAVNKFLLGMKELEVGAQTNADLNGNGTVDGDDALLLLKMVLGIKD